MGLARRVHLQPVRAKAMRMKGGVMGFFKLMRCARGQSATEYMLVLAVVVLGLVSAASHFIPTFNQAVSELAQNVAGWLATNQNMANPQ